MTPVDSTVVICILFSAMSSSWYKYKLKQLCFLTSSGNREKKTCSTLHKKKHISPGLLLAIQIFVKIGRLNRRPLTNWSGYLIVRNPQKPGPSIGVFPKIMVPPNSSILYRVFHYFHHPFWGTVQYHYFWKHHYRDPSDRHLSPCHPTATNGVHLFRSLTPEEVKDSASGPGFTCLQTPKTHVQKKVEAIKTWHLLHPKNPDPSNIS